MILQPESAVRRVALMPGALTIGRAPPSTLLLETPEVSHTHCRIDVDGDDVSVTDLKSTNGTFIDNKRLTGTVPLPHGALLRVGNFVLTCEYQKCPALRGSRHHPTQTSVWRSDSAAAAPWSRVVRNKTKKSAQTRWQISIGIRQLGPRIFRRFFCRK